MTGNNPNLDLVNINAYTRPPGGVCAPLIPEKMHWPPQIPEMMCNNPKLDLANMYAYIKFGENMSSSSRDIERKRNFSVNQGP